MTARKIPLTIPEEVWGRLATLAARRHTDVPSLIAVAIDLWVTGQSDDLRTRRTKRRGLQPGSSLDALAEELYAARQARKTA